MAVLLLRYPPVDFLPNKADTPSSFGQVPLTVARRRYAQVETCPDKAWDAVAFTAQADAFIASPLQVIRQAVVRASYY